MPDTDCHAECQDCKGNYFRFVDWTQNPTPFEPSPPSPSKDDEEEAKKRKLEKEKRRKKIQEEEDALKAGNVRLEDLGVDDDFEKLKEKDEEELAMEHVWQQEMDVLTEDGPEGFNENEGVWGPKAKKAEKIKWWQKIFGSPKQKGADSDDSLWTDEYKADPDTEVGLLELPGQTKLDESQKKEAPLSRKLWSDEQEEGPETEKDLQELSEGMKRGVQGKSDEKQTVTPTGKLWTDQQEEGPETEKGLQTLPDGVKRGTQEESDERQRKPASATGKLWTDQQEQGPETENGLQEPSERISSRQQGEMYKDAQQVPEGMQRDAEALPKEMLRDAQMLPEGMQKDAQMLPEGMQKDAQLLPEGMQRDAYAISEGAQGDGQALPEALQRDLQPLREGTQGDVQTLSEGAQGDGRALAERMQGDAKELHGKTTSKDGLTGLKKSDKELKSDRKRKRSAHRKAKRDRRRKENKMTKIKIAEQAEKGPESKPKTLLDEEPWKPGDLDAATRRRYEIDEMWYRVQTDRFMPTPSRPLAPHWRWHTALKVKHYIQKILNPFDTLRSRMYYKDKHGKPRGAVRWEPSGRGGWGCGCPALPCICHLHPKKPPTKIPKGMSSCSGGAPSRLMERVTMRVRIEERLHEKLADLPPPQNQSAEPLFCLGVEKCVARQAMTAPLIAAAERTRVQAVKQFPCDPQCTARCVIAYADTVKMLRLQAAEEVIGKGATQMQTPSKQGKRGAAGPFNLKLTSTKKDMKYLREKCAELRQGAPFATKAVCYRMEEVRGVGRRGFSNVSGIPVSASSATAGEGEAGGGGERGARAGAHHRRHQRGRKQEGGNTPKGQNS